MPFVDGDVLESNEAWMAARTDLRRWRPTLETIRRRHGLDGGELHAFPTGSAVVAALNEAVVVKIFHPRDVLDCARETACFSLAERDVAVPLPRPVAAGSLDGLPYLVMTRLQGMSLTEAWPAIAPEHRRRLLAALGEATRQLHGLDVPTDAPMTVDWPRHLAEQRRTAVERQRARKLPASWCDQIERFLAAHPVAVEGPCVLLHTELMRDHVLVQRAGDDWRLTGLYDFAEAMTGPPEYEFASVGLFVSEGDPALLRAFLAGYGYDAAACTPGLSRRLLAYTLYHRYANLSWYLDRLPPPAGATNLDDLADRWFGLGPDRERTSWIR